MRYFASSSRPALNPEALQPASPIVSRRGGWTIQMACYVLRNIVAQVRWHTTRQLDGPFPMVSQCPSKAAHETVQPQARQLFISDPTAFAERAPQLSVSFFGACIGLFPSSGVGLVTCSFGSDPMDWQRPGVAPRPACSHLNLPWPPWDSSAVHAVDGNVGCLANL